jgi:hypothetical protein
MPSECPVREVRLVYGGDGDVRRWESRRGRDWQGRFLSREFRPPTIRPPTGLWGAFGGLMIRGGAPENAVFGAGQAGMTLSDRHTHNLAVRTGAGKNAVWASAAPERGKPSAVRATHASPLLQGVLRTRPLGRG